MSLLGHDVRAVGRIKQTIQCVHKGRIQGTIHLQAKVVRDLYSTLGVDCVASAKTYFRLTGQEPPDPPDEEYDDEDPQKDVTNLDDTIANNADDTKSVKDDDKNEYDDDARNSTAEKAEVTDDENNARAPGTEVYEGKKGVNYNWWRPQSYDPFPRKGDDMPPAQAYGYDDTDEDNDQDPLLEQVDPTHDDEKFCKTCYMSDYPPNVFLSHHTVQILACPSISNIDKQRLIERYKKGLYQFPSYPK